MSTEEKRNILTKDTDFSGWYRYMLVVLVEEKLADKEGKIIKRVNASGVEEDQEWESYSRIIKHMHSSVISGIPPHIDSGSELLEHLKEQRLGGNKYELKKKYRNFRMLEHQRDAIRYINDLSALEFKIKCAGGKVTAEEKYAKLTSDLNVHLYSTFIIRIREEYDMGEKRIDDDSVKSIQRQLINYSSCIPLEYLRPQRDRKEENVRKSEGFQERECSICKEKIPNVKCKKNPKMHVWQSHDTKDHKENKQTNVYSSSVLLDTCASTHLIKEIPTILDTSIKGTVRGSVQDSIAAKIIGTGEFKTGNIKFTGQIAPKLDANLISAGKLIKEGYTAIMRKDIEPGVDIQIKKDETLVATGHVTGNNMIQINENLTEILETTRKTTLLDHQKEGHIGKSDCPICIEAKRRKLNTVKGKGRQYEPLEKISIDMQGPLSIQGIDGSRYNMKIVDSKSKYVTVIPTTDKTSSTTRGILEYYVDRNERDLGKKVKYAATDGGTEFYGEFLDLLEKKGIQKIKGSPYDHSFPPDAENANRILNGLTRSNLLQSKLPSKYWPYAMKYSGYSYNRHGKPSPYEKFKRRPPRVNQLQPFGTVCYVHTPIEKRAFKFDPVREKCRLLGYADDDELEIMNGYVLLREKDNEIIYSKDVVFPSIPEFLALPQSEDEVYENALYEIGSVSSDEEYIEHTNVDDNSTQIATGTEDSTQSILEIAERSSEDHPISSRTRRQAMTSEQIQRIREEEESEVSNTSIRDEEENEEFNTAADITMDEIESSTDESEYTENANYTEHQNQEDDFTIQEYEEIWESGFTNYNDDQVCYRTHKQDPSIPRNYKQLLKMKDNKDPEYVKYEEAIKMEEENMIIQEVYDPKDIMEEQPKDENGKPIRYIDSVWAFAKMYDGHGKLVKYKARLCGRGFREIQGLDYEEVYSPTVKASIVRGTVAIAAGNQWKIYQDDCKAAYLNALLQKWKLLKLPDGRFVYIKKCLYGLKESAREWFKLLKSFLISLGFKQNQADACTFFKVDVQGKLEIVIAVFVDDIMTTGKQEAIDEFREVFKKRFKVSEKGGICKHFLSIRFTEDDEYIYLDQTTYINQKLEDYKPYLHPYQGSATALPTNFQELLLAAEESNETEPSFPYKALVGSLVYASNCTRFDITAAVSIVSRFGNNPKKIHCDMVRRIYYFLRSNPSKLSFKKGAELKMVGYCDASLGNLENYSSLAGFCFMLGHSIISWKSFKEPVVALSTAEAEYIALTSAVQECIYLQQFFTGLGFKMSKTEIHEDNEACIALAKNPQDKKRTRHIQIRFHWIREQLEKEVFQLIPTRTFDQLADLFTKGLNGPQLRTISRKLGLVHDSSKQGESESVDASQKHSRTSTSSETTTIGELN